MKQVVLHKDYEGSSATELIAEKVQFNGCLDHPENTEDNKTALFGCYSIYAKDINNQVHVFSLLSLYSVEESDKEYIEDIEIVSPQSIFTSRIASFCQFTLLLHKDKYYYLYAYNMDDPNEIIKLKFDLFNIAPIAYVDNNLSANRAIQSIILEDLLYDASKIIEINYDSNLADLKMLKIWKDVEDSQSLFLYFYFNSNGEVIKIFTKVTISKALNKILDAKLPAMTDEFVGIDNDTLFTTIPIDRFVHVTYYGSKHDKIMNRTFGAGIDTSEPEPVVYLIKFSNYFGYRLLLDDLLSKIKEYFKSIK